jgi:hypothetical protein
MILIFANTYLAGQHWAHERNVKPSGWRWVRQLSDVRGYAASEVVVIEGTRLNESQRDALDHLRVMKAMTK